MRRLLAVLACSAALPCIGANADAAKLTGMDILMYKTTIGSGCRDQGMKRKHARVDVERRCRCVTETLDARMTDAEWRQAAFFAQQRRDKDEAEVFAPHMKAVQECK